MSHIVEIKAQVKDATAVAAACRRLKLADPRQETVTLFSAEVTGLVVRLPKWIYPNSVRHGICATVLQPPDECQVGRRRKSWRADRSGKSRTVT